MATTPARRIAPDELDELLERAWREEWSELALIRPDILWRPHDVLPERVFLTTAWPAAQQQYTKLKRLTRLVVLGLAVGPAGCRALANLTNLQQLDLSGTYVGNEGARALAQLTNLQQLELSSNQVGDEGARALANLTNLQQLDLRGNRVGDEGARALANLTNLQQLNLNGNRVGDEGARVLAKLTNLQQLHLYFNQVGDEGARALAKLTDLQQLDLRGNQVGHEGARAILDDWSDSRGGDGAARQRRILDLRNNGDLSMLVSTEVLETGNAQSILAAYRRFRDENNRPLNEAKLLVVGNEAVGKTSLTRYLVKRKPRDPDEKKTPGTAIQEKIETESWCPDGSTVSLNIWDFGGQEIMHGTHRFFLTARSLYLLVLEDRREDDRSVFQWLKTIRSRGGDSPVIVVINKCDDGHRHLRLDETTLKREYPSVVAVVATSCDPGTTAASTIEQLRTLITRTIRDDERLKHVRDPIPRPWSRVKDAVAALARDEPVLPFSRYVELCCTTADDGDGAAIDNPDEQQALLGLLHDLGVVVAHGLKQDDPAALREITLLDPNWLTGAIYTLLNSREILDQGGEFPWTQLCQLLDSGPYPAARHEFILQMMMNEELGQCFQLPGGGPACYLLPEALPSNEPDYSVWPSDALRFRYQYEILPPGLIPRFIVQAHHHLTRQPTRWRTGVILSAEGCRILVRGNRDRNTVEIAVDGTGVQPRLALSIIRSHFDQVHGHFPELGVQGRVPLPQQPEVDVSYDHLEKLERAGVETYFPEGADQSYSVKELLAGVRMHAVAREKAAPRAQASPPSRTIQAGDGATITVIEGGMQTAGDASIGTAARERAAGNEKAPVASQPAPPQGWWKVAATSAVAVVVMAVIIYLLPSNRWRVIVGALSALGVLVFLVVLARNPANFYRRVLSYVLVAGLAVGTLGFVIEGGVKSGDTLGWFRWDGNVSSIFFVAWAAIVAFLTWADVKLRLGR